MDLEQEAVLRVVLFYTEVDVVGEWVEDHLLEGGLHHMTKVVTRLHTTVYKSGFMLAQQKLVHLSDEDANLQWKNVIK